MSRLILLSAVLFFVVGCVQEPAILEKDRLAKNTSFRFYSTAVKDSFSISVNLPEGYDENGKTAYPVAYLLDANVYFDITVAVLNKYTEIGLLPPIILVGIGYKDLMEMDSLRDRDYTYPEAIPEYEMDPSGDGNKFLSFIGDELMPRVDKGYKTDTNNRMLLGHSLGGYFTAYALLQELTSEGHLFKGFIAASPSFHYNKYYLLEQFRALPPRVNMDKKVKVYFTYGGLEDIEDAEDTSLMENSVLLDRLRKEVGEKQKGSVNYKADMYTGLGHMDTPIPSIIKGLQWVTGYSDSL